MKKYLFILILLLLSCLCIADIINAPDSSKAIALSGISCLENQASIFNNPAAQYILTNPKINLGFIVFGADFYGSATMGLRLSDNSGLSIGFLSAKNKIFGLSYGQKMDFGALGTTIRLLQGSNSSIGISGDLGASTALSSNFFLIPDKTALSINNLGTKYSLFSENTSDINIRMSFLYTQAGFGIDLALLERSQFEISAGYEYNLAFLNLRGGIKYSDNIYFSGGFNLKFGGDEIAYSVALLEGSKLLHQISITMDISASNKKEETRITQEVIELKENIKDFGTKAMELYQSGKLREAIEFWNKILKLEPTNNLAKEYIKSARKMLKENIDTHFTAIDTAYKENKYGMAIEELEKILALEPSNQTATDKILKIKSELIETYNAGIIYADEKQYIKAIEKWQWVLDRVPNYSDLKTRIEKIQEEMKTGKNEDELINKYYSDAVEEHNKGNLQACINNIKNIFNLNPKNEKTLLLFSGLVDENFKAGMKFYGQNLFENAIAEWKKVLSIDPSNEKAAFYINEAGQQLQEKIMKFYNAGIDEYNAGNYLKAIDQWKIALASDPTHKEMNEYMIKAMISQGILYYRQDKLNEAIEYWEKAEKLNPKEEKIAIYLKRAKNKQKALSDLDKKQ